MWPVMIPVSYLICQIGREKLNHWSDLEKTNITKNYEHQNISYEKNEMRSCLGISRRLALTS
jgi:hypothetical protein